MKLMTRSRKGEKLLWRGESAIHTAMHGLHNTCCCTRRWRQGTTPANLQPSQLCSAHTTPSCLHAVIPLYKAMIRNTIFTYSVWH
jgi:hypothetical protein